MSLIAQLEQLQELPDPALPAYWPQTWGWGVLLALLLGLTAWRLFVFYRKWQANAYRRQALVELEQLLNQWQQSPQNPAPLRDLPGLLKRAALARLGPDAPGLTRMSGNDWQQLLQQMSPATLPATFATNLAALAYADDQSLQQQDLGQLIAHCRQWLETHHDPV